VNRHGLVLRSLLWLTLRTRRRLTEVSPFAARQSEERHRQAQ
jgi:hypothetical protein